MGAFITKQPNGLYCRFSSVVDCPTHWNMTEEEYIEMCAEKAREEARHVLASHVRPFEWIIDNFVPNNMKIEEFEKLLRDVGYEGDFEYEEDECEDSWETKATIEMGR